MFDIYTIIFLALAVFIFLRLRSVLGQRTGRERPPYDPYSSARDAMRPSPGDKVVALPGRAPDTQKPSEPVKPADQADELGDLLWYGQLYLNATGWSLLGVVQRNVAKLIERFKGLSYTTEGAVNRDKSAEAQAQEAVS